MADANEPIRVTVTRVLPFSAERVFDAFLNPAIARKFLFATDSGQMVRADIDARVGGTFNFTDRRDGEDVEHTGEYLEIDRPRRLVFTFGVPKYSPDFDRVEVDITPNGAGCSLTLTEFMAPENAEWAERSKGGWAMILGNLEKALR